MTKRKSWNNESRKRKTEPGAPTDKVTLHVRMKRATEEAFKERVYADPVWGEIGMGPLIVKLIDRWMKGEIKA